MTKATLTRLKSGAILLAVLTLAGCSSANSSGTASAEETNTELTPLVVNYEPSSGFAVLEVAVNEGIFEENGLDVELKPGGNAASAISLLINGQVNVVPGGYAAPILASSEGIDVQIASNFFADRLDKELGPQYGTLVREDSGIKSWGDLAGKKVGINSLNCCWQFWTSDLVESAGGDPESVEFLQVPFPNQLQALEQKQVDAITTAQPFTSMAANAGYRLIGATALEAYGLDEGGGAVATMAKSFIEGNPEVLQAWQKSMAEASEWANDNPDEMRSIIATSTGIEEEVLKAMPLPYFTAVVDEVVLDKEIDFLVKYGVMKEEDAPSATDLLAPGATG